MTHFFWFWLPPIGYMVAIFSVSSLSNPQIGGETPDYVLHALEYFLLALLLMRGTLAQQFAYKGKPLWDLVAWHQACVVGVLLTIGYGMTDELHQYFIPGRHCSLHDVFADAAGAGIAYGVATLDYVLLTRCHAWRRIGDRFKAVRFLSYVPRM